MYSEEFKQLVLSASEKYIGNGNPGAKILFIGQEPALDKENEEDKAHIKKSIDDNRADWIKLLTAPDYHACDGYESPLNPWPEQKFQCRSFVIKGKDRIVRGEKGTSLTWYNYQKIINKIYGEDLDRNEKLTLHRKAFHTDMSAVVSKHHNGKILKEGKESVHQRIDLLSQPFFRQFPVVIAAVGNFPRDSYGDEYFKKVFGKELDYKGNLASENMPWINVNIKEGTSPQIIIHCRQVTARGTSDRYFDRIVEIIHEFAARHNILL